MEKNANYGLVGLSTLILLTALVVFFIWLARLRVNAEYDLYDIVFAGPVRGLNEGGERRIANGGKHRLEPGVVGPDVSISERSHAPILTHRAT